MTETTGVSQRADGAVAGLDRKGEQMSKPMVSTEEWAAEWGRKEQAAIERREGPTVSKSEELAYLVEYLDANLHEISEATLFDVAAVAGDVAILGRIMRTVPDLVEALTTLLQSLEWEEKRSGTTYNGYESARAAIRAAGVPE